MPIPGNLRTTAMAVMPHTDSGQALEAALSLQTLLEGVWAVLDKKGIDTDYVLSRSLISPATCCLVNPDGEKTVEKAFGVLQGLSQRLREKYSLA